MEKPLLLLDVDGVLCPFEEQEGFERFDVPHPFSHLKHGGWDGLWVWVGQAERLRRLADSFEFHWATAWEDHANETLLEIHGLDRPLDVIYFDHRGENRRDDGDPDWEGYPDVEGARRGLTGIHTSGSVQTWKLPWVRAWAEWKGLPFAWVDDDIQADAVAWAEDRTEAGIPTLCMYVAPNRGLTDDHVEELLAWADGGNKTDG